MSRFLTGQVLFTGTAAYPLTASTEEMAVFLIKASLRNTGAVALGDSTVTASTGYELDPGELFSYGLQIEAGESTFDAKLKDLYVTGTSGDKVTWFAHRR